MRKIGREKKIKSIHFFLIRLYMPQKGRIILELVEIGCLVIKKKVWSDESVLEFLQRKFNFSFIFRKRFKICHILVIPKLT